MRRWADRMRSGDRVATPDGRGVVTATTQWSVRVELDPTGDTNKLHGATRWYLEVEVVPE